MLLINNDDVAAVLIMADTIAALEASYAGLATGDTVCRPRIDIRIPTSDPSRLYQWGTMEGGSTSGYFAIRLKSDVLYEENANEIVTQEKYCLRPGLYCGLVLLFDTATGAPLALINDGVLQHMRVGADGGIGVKCMSREDARVVGMLGSGGMARTHMEAFATVRAIDRLQVYSPTRANCERFAREVRDRYGIDVAVCEQAGDIYRGADIVAALTDSAVPVLEGDLLEPGTHVVNIGGGGRPDAGTLDRIDVYLRFGNAPAPQGRDDLVLDDEYLTFAARPDLLERSAVGRRRKRSRGVLRADRVIYYADLAARAGTGRASPEQITYSERGNLQGAQFWAVAAVVYEKAREKGLGREIPTEWLLQDIRD